MASPEDITKEIINIIENEKDLNDTEKEDFKKVCESLECLTKEKQEMKLHLTIMIKALELQDQDDKDPETVVKDWLGQRSWFNALNEDIKTKKHFLKTLEFYTEATKIILNCYKEVKPAGPDKESTILLKAILDKCDKKEKYQRVIQMINDPIHGSIELSSLEKAIINTPEFFRLKDIKQLGGKVHVYPGATHTRFEHSIGVCHLAGEFAQHLKCQREDMEAAQQQQQQKEEDKKIIEEEMKLIKIKPKEVICLRLAGLCHDLGHGPFSHLFESVTKKLVKKYEKEKHSHEILSKLMFKKILLDHPLVLVNYLESGLRCEDIEVITNMIGPEKKASEESTEEGKRKFLYEIVANKSSGVDVDKWDYFARDYFHLGINNEFDWRRCMKTSSIVKVGDQYHIGFRGKELINMYAMFRTRSTLYHKSLRHPTVVAIEMMIRDILIYSAEENSGKLIKDAVCSAFDQTKADLGDYITLTDSVLYWIEHQDPSERVKELITRLKKRELYKMIDEKSFENKNMEEECGEINKDKEEKEEKYEYKPICFKFGSEGDASGNPIDRVYFFEKPKEDTPKIPTGEKEGDLTRDTEKMSDLCKPKVYVEYKVRLYRKTTSKEKDDEESKEFKKWCKKNSNDPLMRAYSV